MYRMLGLCALVTAMMPRPSPPPALDVASPNSIQAAREWQMNRFTEMREEAARHGARLRRLQTQALSSSEPSDVDMSEEESATASDEELRPAARMIRPQPPPPGHELSDSFNRLEALRAWQANAIRRLHSEIDQTQADTNALVAQSRAEHGETMSEDDSPTLIDYREIVVGSPPISPTVLKAWHSQQGHGGAFSTGLFIECLHEGISLIPLQEWQLYMVEGSLHDDFPSKLVLVWDRTQTQHPFYDVQEVLLQNIQPSPSDLASSQSTRVPSSCARGRSWAMGPRKHYYQARDEAMFEHFDRLTGFKPGEAQKWGGFFSTFAAGQVSLGISGRALVDETAVRGVRMSFVRGQEVPSPNNLLVAFDLDYYPRRGDPKMLMTVRPLKRGQLRAQIWRLSPSALR